MMYLWICSFLFMALPNSYFDFSHVEFEISSVLFELENLQTVTPIELKSTSVNAIDSTDLDNTAMWYSSSYTNDGASGSCDLKLDLTKVVRDTLVDNRYAQIIGSISDGIYLPESEFILYAKNGKYYFYENAEWKLLYDFTAVVGDTISYYIPSQYRFYSLFEIPNITGNPDEITLLNPHRLIITKVDSIYDQSSNALKRFATKQISNGSSHRMNTIVEKVGSLDRIFGSNIIFALPECSEDYLPKLRCYSDQTTFIKFVTGLCEKPVSTLDRLTSSINLYPNPGTDLVFINLPEDIVYPAVYTISSVSGIQVKKAIISSSSDNNIQTLGIPSGIYIFQLKDKTGHLWSTKWVRE